MGRKALATNKNAKIPKHITDIAMTPEDYYEFKVYIKSIVLPGTPAFEFKRLAINDNKQIYREWLNNALKHIGPRFFPEGANSLVWPEDRDSIYRTVHQAVRILSIGIRMNYKMRELRAAREKADDDEMDMAPDDDLHEDKGVDDTGDTNDTGERGVNMIPEDNEGFVLWQEEERRIMESFWR